MAHPIKKDNHRTLRKIGTEKNKYVNEPKETIASNPKNFGCVTFINIKGRGKNHIANTLNIGTEDRIRRKNNITKKMRLDFNPSFSWFKILQSPLV
jgi:hypothetical protein